MKSIETRIRVKKIVVEHMALAQAYEGINRSQLVNKAIEHYLRENGYLDINDEISFNKKLHG